MQSLSDKQFKLGIAQQEQKDGGTAIIEARPSLSLLPYFV
jgi:hypothetical protein